MRKVFQTIAQKAGQISSSSEDDNLNRRKRDIEIARLNRELAEEDRRMKEMANPPESVLQHYQALQEKLEAQREAERQDRHRLEDEKLQRIEADQAAASQRAEQMEAERENLKDELNKERLESMRRDFA